MKGGIPVGKRNVSKKELIKDKETALEVYSKGIENQINLLCLLKRKKNFRNWQGPGVATLKYARISPRKVKIVLDLIRNKDIDEAYAI